MKILGIIQARTGSTRLPNKVMMKITGKPMLEHLINRMQRAKSLDELIIATTRMKEDDVIVDLAHRCGLRYYRGPSKDVLKRIVLAAKQYNGDLVVRITGDNPLTDPIGIDRMVKKHLQKNPDYSINFNEPTLPCPKCLPDGTGAETIYASVLEKINKIRLNAGYREHVTLYIKEHPEMFNILHVIAPSKLRSNTSFTVDTIEDFNFLDGIYNKFYKEGEIIKLEDVISLINK